MPSSISDLDLIDERYPEAGTNQSSQPFRTNFATIKNNLLSAQNDLNELFSTSITIDGDVATTDYSSKITFYDAARTSSNVLNLQVFIKPIAGLTAGTYETKDHDVTFTVDQRGILTSVSQTDKETFNVVGKHDVKLDHYFDVAEYAATKLTIPVFTVDKYGRIIAVEDKQLGNFGFKGQPVSRGDILVGEGVSVPMGMPDGILNSMPIKKGKPNAPYIFDPWEINVLNIKNTSQQEENPFQWRDISPYARGGTLTEIAGIDGISAVPALVNPLELSLKTAYDDKNTYDKYTLSLDINGLTEFAGTAEVDAADYIPIYDGSNTKVYKIKASKFLLSAGTGTKYIEWAKPELGGELDVHGFAITTKYGNLDLRVDAIGKLRFNGQVWPKTMGTDGQVLVTDSQGILQWKTLEEANQGSVTEISVGTGLQTSTFTTITESGTISLAFQNLPTINNVDNDLYIPTVSLTNNTHHKIKATDLSIQTIRSYFVNSAIGFDTNDGTINAPFRTISAAINSIPVGGETYIIYVWPGRYEENVAVSRPNVTIKGLASYKDVSIVGADNGPAFRVTEELYNTVLSNLTIDTRSTCTYDLDTNTATGVTTALLITGGDNLTVENCAIYTFYNPIDSVSSPTRAVKVQTTVKGQIVFRNCDIVGVIENVSDYNGLRDSTDPNEDTDTFYPILFDGNVYSNNYPPTFIVGNDDGTSNPYTIINNYSSVNAVKHITGTLMLTNVLNVGASFASTAPLASSNKLILKNVSLRASGFGGNNFSTTAETYTAINKTGTCEYEFSNVDRNPSIDILNGNRLNYGGVKTLDIVSTSVKKTISSNTTLDLHQTDNWELTVTNSSTVTLSFTDFAANNLPVLNLSNRGIFTKQFNILVYQDSVGGKNLTFQVPAGETLIWDNSDSQPSIAQGANKATMFTFAKFGTTWYGSRVVVTKESNTQETVLITSGSTYSITPDNKIVLVRKTIDGAITITLPNTSSLDVGHQVTIKDVKGKAATNTITINPFGSEHIDASSHWDLITNYASITFVWTGYEWSSI